MHIKNLLDNVKVIRTSGATVAGTTDVDGAVIDMTQDEGYNAVLFVASLGDVTVNSVVALQARQSVNADGSSSTLIGATADATATATSADNKLLLTQVVRMDPLLGKYAFQRLKRGTANAVIEWMGAVLFDARKYPCPADVSELARKALAVV